LLDTFTSKGDVTAGYAILFAICAFAYVVTFLFHHLLAPSLEPLKFKNAK
jgi:ACS family hexuronate transporter-like MFS transporter